MHGTKNHYYESIDKPRHTYAGHIQKLSGRTDMERKENQTMNGIAGNWLGPFWYSERRGNWSNNKTTKTPRAGVFLYAVFGLNRKQRMSSIKKRKSCKTFILIMMNSQCIRVVTGGKTWKSRFLQAYWQQICQKPGNLEKRLPTAGGASHLSW